MDAHRFDNWTRNRALRLSRRDALRLVGATGAASMLPAMQGDALAQSSCSLTLHAETLAGPSAPTAYDGTLQFTLGADGTFTNATFTSDTGESFPATGRATGRAFDVALTLDGNQTLSFSGTGEESISTCPDSIAGILSGPLPGDLGTWKTTASQSAGASTSSGSSSAAASASTAGSGQSSLSCPAPQIACGQNCCPGGATCTNANQGLCTCPDGTEQCGVQCVPTCPDGQFLDLDTCRCSDQEAACIQNQQSCQNHGQCCSGYCGGGTCFDCAGKVCGDFGCIDPSRDSQNCGNCGNICFSPQVCSNGVCGCGQNGAPCVFDDECCSQACMGGLCGTCDGNPWTYCGGGTCIDPTRDPNNCGSCGNVCQGEFGGITCDSGVCHDIRNDSDYCGLQHLVCPSGQICRGGSCVTP